MAIIFVLLDLPLKESVMISSFRSVQAVAVLCCSGFSLWSGNGFSFCMRDSSCSSEKQISSDWIVIFWKNSSPFFRSVNPVVMKIIDRRKPNRAAMLILANPLPLETEDLTIFLLIVCGHLPLRDGQYR